MSEVPATIRYTQATIDEALALMQSGITVDEVFASVVEELRMYRCMLNASEAKYITLDLSVYDEPEDDPSYPYSEHDEYDGEDTGRYDFPDYERDDGI